MYYSFFSYKLLNLIEKINFLFINLILFFGLTNVVSANTVDFTKKGLILVIIGFLLIIFSLLLVAYNYYEDKKAGTESKKIYEKLKNKDIKEDIITLENKEEKVVNIEGNNYIGTINIPILNLELPVMSDWDYNKMKISPCRYYGSIYTNDLVICAHAYDNLFGRIKKLNSGDLLILTDILGNEYIYEVKVIEILSQYDVNKMIENEFDLTLYTCTKDGLNRVTVRLNRV